MRRQRIVRIASMSSASRKRATTVHRTLPVPAVRSMVGRLALWQSVISGPKRWMNDEMGKAAHAGVGRLLSLADLGNWPHKGVIQMGGSNEFVRPSTSSAGARLHEQRAVGEVLRYLSVCSGIEAATVAWGPLGWKPVAFSEVERFPCAVLAHHYPARRGTF